MTTTKKKSFDCVEMKNRIQAELQEEWRGMSDDEIRTEISDTLSKSDSPVAQLWKRISSQTSGSFRTAAPRSAKAGP
ncbi:MAG: hypothetical protein E4H02_09730 [Lentisphaerales bacterium]|jgi:hypothetical protein|nr:MAG: hypothetical protein E4H02_09730 [Lentisphaerales bacterium]